MCVFREINWKIFLFPLLLTGCLFSRNNYPIVLVHGLFGWGKEEMGDYRYWGGTSDLEVILEKAGYTVYTVSVGPISSNWDRAVEVYYQLKGGQVDYGLGHSKAYGLVQKPGEKTYSGLYPEWNSNHPVHLVGHSMGGQTIRMLEYLLTNQIYADSKKKILEESALLGRAREGWISSITSIATPHDGSTLVDIIPKIFPFIQYFIGLAGVVGTDFYDFDLEQWEFKRGSNETWTNYVQRMREHPAWDSKNISAWDVSVNGASELNGFLTSNPSVFYFSYIFSASHQDSTTGHHVPNKDVFLLIRSRARLIGSKVIFRSDGTETDSTWWENDGIVNVCSMAGPTTGINGSDPITPYVEGDPLIQGQWYTFGPIKMDHYQSVGHMIYGKQRAKIDSLYLNHAELLYTLPAQ